MPTIEIRNAYIHYDEYGTAAETVVFSHGLLWSGEMFREQTKALQNQYRCFTYDHRGQGRSEVTSDGYDMDSLTEDALEFIKKVVGKPCHFVGLSMGGFIAMRLAARYPEWIKSVILLETSADPEPPENVPRYNTLNTVVRWLGTWAVASKVMQIMFGQKFLTDPSRAALRKEWRKKLTSNKKTITKAVQGVIERKPVFEELKNIKAPVLIMVGDQDVATVPAKSERIKSQIPQAELVIIPGAGHTSTVEEPEFVNQKILEFLEKIFK
ncbi:MAG: alpha/beta hydrolase [Microscillaceae bacterium]|nr:alpha/beta hydrolase [Microscillaceae bacterium]